MIQKSRIVDWEMMNRQDPMLRATASAMRWPTVRDSSCNSLTERTFGFELRGKSDLMCLDAASSAGPPAGAGVGGVDAGADVDMLRTSRELVGPNAAVFAADLTGKITRSG